MFNQLDTLRALKDLYYPMGLSDALRWAYFIDGVITQYEHDTLGGGNQVWWLRELAYLTA